MTEKNLADILAACQDSIEQEERTVEECLVPYPEHREELKSLLGAAAVIRERAGFSPRPGFHSASRARLLRRLTPRQSATPRQSVRHARQQTYPLFLKRFAMLWAAVFVLAVSLLGGGTVYASSSTLPGDVLYPAKLFIEDARLFLASDVDDVSLAAGFAQTRMEEIQSLIALNREKDLPLAVDLFSNRVAVATESLIVVAQDNPERAIQLGIQVEQILAYDTEKLNALLEIVPPEAKPAIERAILASSAGQGVAQGVIEGSSPDDGSQREIPAPADKTPPRGGPPDESPEPDSTRPAGGPPGGTPGPPAWAPGGRP